MYGIHYDPTEQVLHLRLEGFWTEATLADFAGELLKTVKTLHAQGRRYAVLSDSSRFPIQSPQVAAGFERIMAAGAVGNPAPTAIVVASMLNKKQAERTLKNERVHVFLDEGAARAWLLAEMARPPA